MKWRLISKYSQKKEFARITRGFDSIFNRSAKARFAYILERAQENSALNGASMRVADYATERAIHA